jgi:Leucine-rich repeat (LRR) protein
MLAMYIIFQLHCPRLRILSVRSNRLRTLSLSSIEHIDQLCMLDLRDNQLNFIDSSISNRLQQMSTAVWLSFDQVSNMICFRYEIVVSDYHHFIGLITINLITVFLM